MRYHGLDCEFIVFATNVDGFQEDNIVITTGMYNSKTYHDSFQAASRRGGHNNCKIHKRRNNLA